MKTIYLGLILSPLIGSIISGIFGTWIGRKSAHFITILGVLVSFVLSVIVFKDTIIDGNVFNDTVYTWLISGGYVLEVGLLVDSLTAIMLIIVTFVSLMVHIYTVGYMSEDPGYKRFFSYISLFTFSMLTLVMSNNFMQLFFGWEAVGLVSYLLIGFWYTKPTAIYANLKAFLVNRVGDFGFLLGIAGVLYYFGSLDYETVFLAMNSSQDSETMTLICLLLFVGAMGKSAQVPLHVWLPDSMEGPTPISALIHAATMVTAGVFMVARMSPLFESSEIALSVIIIIGATTALFMGFLGIIQDDIKKVVAYSTLSQLGYMTVALGASAYSAGVFHLMTHAFFKALLFLAAGSVIIAMHHEQNIRNMGGLKKYMPITYWTSLVGSLALIGFPGFSGFFSKDAIIEAVHASNIFGSTYAYYAILAGVFITALYSFRMFFLVFHGKPRFDTEGAHQPHESPWVITLPLLLLAVPSVLIGGYFIGDMLFGDFFESAIIVAPEHDTLAIVGKSYNGIMSFIIHGLMGPAFWLAMAGVLTAGLLYLKFTDIPPKIYQKLKIFNNILENKYYFDWFNAKIFGGGSIALGNLLWKISDSRIIDGWVVNGSAKLVGWCSSKLRYSQTGMLYTYAFAMIIGLVLMISWVIFRGQ